LHAVHGNSDAVALRERLPAVGTFEALGRRFVFVHGHEHERTSLSLLARQENADCVVVGHTHRPGIETLGDVILLNPGSHADPRGGLATHAEVGRTSAGVTATIVTTGGKELTAGQV
jgi:putative phosphoesterase